jgi:hypothetical protein
MYDVLHTRRAADLEVAIWLDPHDGLFVHVSDGGGQFALPARDGHDALDKFWHPYLYLPPKEV